MGFDSMEIDFNYWFFNSGGNSAPNDYLNISLNNGSTSLPILNSTQSSSRWRETKYKSASTDFPFTNEMKLVIKTEDVTPGHLVEAGFDKFSAQLIQNTSSTTSPETDLFTFHPNPVSSELFIEVKIIHL
ncbi:MAG: hypothetical protein U0V54_03275 [Saprospiraceae bacterium]